jgi:hypothetical protein
VCGDSAGFLRSLVSVGGWQESLWKIKVYSNLVAAEEGRKGGAMDALWNFGSLRRSSATLAAAEQPPLPPPPHPELAENAVTITAPQVEDQVSGNQVPESMEEEHSSNGDTFLDGREPTEDQVQLAEEEEERLTPIRAPVSRDDDDDDEEGEVGDGDVSFGSGESFDSALERMAASSTGSFDASPAGSFVGAASHLDNEQQQRKKGLGVGQQGALMRLNQMISGESTLDTAVLEDCTEEEFKDKIQEIASSRQLSPTDASISSILEALLPLVRAGGGAQGTASQEMEINEEEEEMTGNNEDELLSKNNRAVEGEGGIVQAEQDQDVADDEEGIVNQEDDEAEEDLDISASVMPVAKLSADDDELIEAEDGMKFYSFSSFCSRHLHLVPVVHDVQILSLLCLKSSGTPNRMLLFANIRV